MAEDGALTGNEQLVNGADTMPQVGLVSQYVKDLSFENPNAPARLSVAGPAADRRAVQHCVEPTG